MTVFDEILIALNRTNKIICNLAGGIPNPEPPGSGGPPMNPIVFSNSMGVLLSPNPHHPLMGLGYAFLSLSATGHKGTLIGRVRFNGIGSKTISAAGGGVYFGAGGVSFVNPLTVVRFGVKDVAASGFEAGVFDVHGDYIGGPTSGINENTGRVPMQVGSKTIANNDLIAISVEMISKAGSDTMALIRRSTNIVQQTHPYGTENIGSGLVRSVTGPVYLLIQFDDGTIGHIAGMWTQAAYNNAEYGSSFLEKEKALLFTLPISAKLTSIAFSGKFNLQGRTEIIVYSDPLGSPTEQHVIIVDKDTNSGSLNTPGYIGLGVHPRFPLVAGEQYAISVKVGPTETAFPTANKLNVYNFLHPEVKDATALGQNWSYGYRSGNTGPFIVDPNQLPGISLYLDELTCT